MKLLIIILAYLFAFMTISGCAIQRNPKREYYSINEIKSFYRLTNKECRAIEMDSTVLSIYHCEKGRLYKLELNDSIIDARYRNN